MEDLYLIHHGIKGQKWGVRRYQNPDGTLTEAGKNKINKNTKYRDKKATFLKSMSDSFNKSRIEEEQNLDDLRKNGIHSETLKKIVEGIDSYNNRYNEPKEKWNNENLEKLLYDEITLTESNIKEYVDYGKSYLDGYNSLMNMSVEDLLKKQNIKNIYKNSLSPYS